ncbi:replication initiation factor domain-containing protein [Bacillus smithii]|uniref:replication initiation factor domain-containing protein n=1 Tax=Bacillus smithii TaxID=1479 RepID=UPI003D20A8AE
MTERVSPPYANRGVENTCPSGLRALVDWVSVTFKNVTSPYDIIDLLGLKIDDFIEFDSGKYGFDSHLRFGHIAIYYYTVPKAENYIHLEVTGQGCREFEQFSKYDWITMLGLFLMLDVNITRFDIAIDDFKGYFSFKQLVRKIKKAEVRSRFRDARIMEKVKLADGETAGMTIYFGSPKSDVNIRIYDKYQERISNGYDIVEGIDKWIRTEIQLRDTRALTAVYELVNNIYSVGSTVQGILRNYVLFVDNNGDKNKSRWPVSRFWEKFLGDVGPLKLSQVAPDMTIQRMKKWFEDSVSASFATLLEAFDNDMNLVREFLEMGKKKMTKKHEDVLNRYKKEREIWEAVERKRILEGPRFHR